MLFKQAIYRIVEKGGKRYIFNVIFDYFIILLILLNVVGIALEPIVKENLEFINVLRIFEVFSVIIFTIEYSLRIYISDLTHPSTTRVKSAFKFILSPYGLIDLFTILPFYIPFIIKVDLRFIRIFRLIRFFRILKISRYNNTLQLIGSVIKAKRIELGMTLFVTTLIIVVASFIMYLIEGDVQPEKFPNVVETFWWAIATLTTIGYGDVYPITGLGKLLSGIIALLGIGLVALPTGIIGAGFIEVLNKSNTVKKTTTCPHCGKEIECS